MQQEPLLDKAAENQKHESGPQIEEERKGRVSERVTDVQQVNDDQLCDEPINQLTSSRQVVNTDKGLVNKEIVHETKQNNI